MKHTVLRNGIPVSISLDPALQTAHFRPAKPQNKKRLLLISAIAVAIACAVSVVAKLLVYLIDLFTNLAFYGRVSVEEVSPAGHSYGPWVILVPIAGGLIVGLMAYYGSKAIRGHGIPEAMEQILTNQSRIKPSITYLKPLSAAISIGTGGPFGAEGPIIATGGALGSTIGQLLRITHDERKVLLAAGATAGMSAIFGSPIAAIFLAIELLLFEFSPRSFIPVALACITGAAGHHLLFEDGYVFSFPFVSAPPSNTALFAYAIMGIVIGLLAVFISKIIYRIEDLFEKLPIHWMWWPAIGGLAVGVVGYISPNTLGVGYSNITDILSGNIPIMAVLSLCIWKFVSWAISLGSGTSGGTLAPLLTIGGAAGALLGSVVQYWFPDAHISLPVAGLVGMSAMFAGASRAYLTSILFALETTGQIHALLPLLAGCTASYFVSYFISENTIMTEKISRRGVQTPYAYGVDLLETTPIADVLSGESVVIDADQTLEEVRVTLEQLKRRENYYIVSDSEGQYKGIVSSSEVFSAIHSDRMQIGDIAHSRNLFIRLQNSLKTAVELMATENVDVLAVVDEGKITGVLSYRNVLNAYKSGKVHRERKASVIRLKRKV